MQVYQRVQLPWQCNIARDLWLLMKQDDSCPPDHQISQLLRQWKLFQLELNGRLALEAEQAQCHAVPELDVTTRAHQHDRQTNLLQGLRVEAVDLIKVFTAFFQFLVRGFQFFIQGLQLFVRGLQLFVRRLQFFAGRLQFLDGRLQLLLNGDVFAVNQRSGAGAALADD